jgi:uncharacterized protein YqeY
MPTIQEKIYQDLKEALKSKKEPELSTLRLIKSEIQYELTKTGAQEILDANLIQLLKKNISQRKESAFEYKKASRLDLAEKEEAEAKVILQYLPAEISMEEIEASIQEAIIAVSAKGLSDSGKVMGKVMLKFKGKNIDGSKVSEAVKRVLQALG